MKFLSEFPANLRLFYGYTGKRFLILLVIVFSGSLTEVIGIAMILPVIELQNPNAERSQFTELIATVYDFLGIDMTLLTLLGMIILLFTFKGMITFVRLFTFERITTRLTLDLQTRVIRALGSLSYIFYTQMTSGTLTNLLFFEAERVTRAYTKFLSVITTTITVALYLATAAVIRAELTIGIIVAGAVVAFLLKFLVTRTRELSHEMSAVSAEGHNEAIQAIHSFLYLKASGSMQRIIERVTGRLSGLIQLRVKLAAISACLHSVVEPLAVVVLAALIFHQTEIEGRPLAEIAVLVLLCYRAFSQLMNVQQEIQRFNESVGGVATFERQTQELEAHQEPSGDRLFDELDGDIRIDDVSFRYGDAFAVHDLQFTIPQNATVGIVGESGAGKSTLVLLLAGVVNPTQGAIRIGEADYRDFDRNSLQEKIGYVTQDPVVFNGNVIENLTVFKHATLDDPDVRARVTDALAKAYCTEFVENLPDGLATVLGERGVTLSGGQRQRIAIARELYKNPPLMIFDEATSSLDTESERIIQQSIEQIRGERTIVIIAHRLSTIRNCDRIYVMSSGTVIEWGTFDELVADEDSRFHTLAEVQRL